MTGKRAFTLDFTAKLLLKRGLISEEQYKEFLIKGDAQRLRLQKYQEASYARRGSHARESILPPEVISSFNFEIPGKNGKVLTEDAITAAVADELGVEYMKIDPLRLNLDTVTAYVSRPFAQKHLVVPVSESGGVLTVAVADPSDVAAIDDIERTKKIKVNTVLSSKSDILKVVREFYGFRSSVMEAQKEIAPSVEIGNLEQYVRLKAHGEIEATDQHVVNAVEYLLQYAFDQRASDIHIEPKRDYSHVRFRIDGVLHYIHKIPKMVHPPIISRIKMLSRMDIAEKRKPQDGRIKTSYKGKEIELRVSTMPVAFGEKVVIRIFDPQLLLQDLDQLGFYPREYQLFNSFINRPNGIILVTGPTGSGKTTTLYSALKALSSPEVNVVTVEDPIEMVMEEFNQVGVQSAIGVTFGNALRTILRQDPDIIMVGEIRDKETAENAVQAALTGHLVLSTLHTNDAPSSITRLLDLEIPSFLISSTLIGIVAQRLVRKICPYCVKERFLSAEETTHLQLPAKKFKAFYGEGCSDCRWTGYKGRMGVFEVMDITERIQKLISDNVAVTALQEAARADGMLTIRQCAVRKMLEGITTYEEVVGITG